MTLRLVIADDHTVVLDGLEAILGLETGIEIVARCTNGIEAVEAVVEFRPDVLVTDVAMPGCDGIEAYATLKERNAGVPTVVLSATLTHEDIIRCLDSGVEGIVLKEAASSTLIEAIRVVAEGGRHIPPDLAARARPLGVEAGVTLQLLGGIALDGPDLSATAASRRRHSLALLALVAAPAPQAVARERLMTLLWPESDSERASNSLRQTLFRIRRDLGEDAIRTDALGGVLLDRTLVKVDLWDFRGAIQRRAYAYAAELYQGPFLDDFHLPGHAEFNRWIEDERDRLKREYAHALEALATEAETQGRHDDAVSWRRRQAATDPYSSRAALALLKALVAAGDRPGAIQYAGVYQSIVRNHLEIEPDPVVSAFIQALRDAPPDEGSHAPEAPGAPRDPAAADKAELAAAGPTEPAAPPRAAPEEEKKGEEPPVASPPPPQETHPAPAPTGLSWAGGWPRLVGVAAVLVVFGIVLIRPMMTGSPPDVPSPAAPSAGLNTVVVLRSAAAGVGGRDRANRIIACDGPACPPGSLPQDAFTVPKHPAYTAATAGTGFIGPAPDGTSVTEPGYDCCTTMTFENEFSLPPDAAVARITGSALADNQAIVTVNGVEVGRHTDSLASGNHGGAPLTFSALVPADPSGANRLRITLWDGGGAVALQYQVVVTYEPETDSDRDGTLNELDAFPNSDLRPTVVIVTCDSGVANQALTDPPGATFADLLARALESGPGPGASRRAAGDLVEQWVEAGLILQAEADRVLACAAEGR